MYGIEIKHIQGTPEWLNWRYTGIGGSDAPVTTGDSPYKTPRMLYFEKKNKAPVEPEEDKAFIFAKGHRTENIIRRELEDLIQEEMVPKCFQHPSLSHMIASLDGVNSKFGILEGKLVKKEVLAKARDHGEIPKHHMIQMQHQFAVTGIPEGVWYGHDGAKNGILIKVKANPMVIDALIDIEAKFWNNLIDGKEPALSQNDYLIPSDVSLLEELREAKELADNAAINFETLKTKVIETFQHDKIRGGGLQIIKSVRKGTVDFAKVPSVKAAFEYAVKNVPAEEAEKYRKKDVEAWTVKIDSGKKA